MASAPTGGDDVGGVALDGVDLLLQRLGIRTDDVGPSEPHDHVGDTQVLETLDTVDGEGVQPDDVDLERFVRLVRVGSELTEPGDEGGQVVVATTVLVGSTNWTVTPGMPGSPGSWTPLPFRSL